LKPFDSDGNFLHPTDEVGKLAVRGAGLTVLSGGVLLVIQILATVILARLLTPADFGAVAVVTTFSLLLMNLGLNGFTEAVLQREEMTDALATNLFWINVGAGTLLSALLATAGSLVAGFFHDDRLVRITEAMSMTIVVTSASVIHLALIKRAMRFDTISTNDIRARAISVIVSILLGWSGWGYWALVAGAIALALSTTIGAWTACRWTPSLPRRDKGTGAMVSFAVHTYGRFTFNYCARNLDNLLVGWRLGTYQLGFYKKAYDLFALPTGQLISPLTSVAVSSLSRLQPLAYRRFFLTAVGVTAFLGMAIGADLTLVGEDVIQVLLGPAWTPSGRIFTFFGPGIGIMLIYYTHGWIHLSIGRADRWLRWSLIEFAVTALLFLVGLHWGSQGIAAAWAVSFWVLTIPAFWYAGKPIDFPVQAILHAVWRFVLAALVAYVAASFVIGRVPLVAAPTSTSELLLRISSMSFLFLSLYLAVVVLLHRSLSPLRQLVRLISTMVPFTAPWRPRSVRAPRFSGSLTPPSV